MSRQNRELTMKILALGPDYMANFSPGPERNPLEMKVAITRGRCQPGLQILARARIFIWPNGLKYP